mmetsp:Transcript_73344/g.185797  ORF Transcript_73344/g.185797 Transcript_73344/m.185797 type:complete len:225 (+) Transcript_73344:835-1509(+)
MQCSGWNRRSRPCCFKAFDGPRRVDCVGRATWSELLLLRRSHSRSLGRLFVEARKSPFVLRQQGFKCLDRRFLLLLPWMRRAQTCLFAMQHAGHMHLCSCHLPARRRKAEKGYCTLSPFWLPAYTWLRYHARTFRGSSGLRVPTSTRQCCRKIATCSSRSPTHRSLPLPFLGEAMSGGRLLHHLAPDEPFAKCFASVRASGFLVTTRSFAEPRHPAFSDSSTEA